MARLRRRVSGPGRRSPAGVPGGTAEGIAVKLGAVVVRRAGRGARRGGIDGGADLLDTLGTAAVGKKAEVTDAQEALGQHMEQEAADELLTRERQHLVAIAVTVVLVGSRTRPSSRASRRASVSAMRWL